jgi:hypothetical protein
VAVADQSAVDNTYDNTSPHDPGKPTKVA